MTMYTHAYMHTRAHACTYLLTTRNADKYDERKSVGGNYNWKSPKLATKK